jgi:peptide/nickel transport system permease protein
VIVGLIVFAAVFAGQLAPHDPNTVDLSVVLTGPSGTHWAGTDGVGRDVLTRLMYGARVSLIVSGVGMLGAILVGVGAGLLSTFGGRSAEFVMLRLIDVQLAFPYVLVAIAITTVAPPTIPILIGLMIVAGWAGTARIVRSIALQERGKDYVKAAEVVGASRWRIARKYVFPSVVPALLALAPVLMSAMIVFESTLSFLGMGVQPPTPTWGGAMLEGREFLTTAWWLTTLPGTAIFITSLGLILIGDGIQKRIGQRVDAISGTVITRDGEEVDVEP